MSYRHQINILEAKLKQLSKNQTFIDETYRASQIEKELKKLYRLEWEENNERIKMEEDR